MECRPWLDHLGAFPTKKLRLGAAPTDVSSELAATWSLSNQDLQNINMCRLRGRSHLMLHWRLPGQVLSPALQTPSTAKPLPTYNLQLLLDPFPFQLILHASTTFYIVQILSLVKWLAAICKACHPKRKLLMKAVVLKNSILMHSTEILLNPKCKQNKRSNLALVTAKIIKATPCASECGAKRVLSNSN